MSIFNFLKHKPKIEEFSAALTLIVMKSIVHSFGEKSREEQIEIYYFLVFQIDRMLFDINPEKRNEIFDAFSSELFISLVKDDISFKDKANALNFLIASYDQRATIYTKCSSFLGEKGGFLPGKGSAVFALSYFLKSASGETNIKFEDVEPLLKGIGEINNENSRAFLDPKEIFQLTVEISTIVIEIKKFLNKFRI